jgi:hypothetical protein
VVLGRIGMTLVVKVTIGQGAKIIAPFKISQNSKSKYPIYGVFDNIHGISYFFSNKWIYGI